MSILEKFDKRSTEYLGWMHYKHCIEFRLPPSPNPIDVYRAWIKKGERLSTGTLKATTK